MSAKIVRYVGFVQSRNWGGGSQTYVVKQGDTLTSIARAFGVTVAQLQEWNNIEDPNLIRVGQVLIVSAPSAAEKPELYPLPDGIIQLTTPYTSGEHVFQVQRALAALYFTLIKALLTTELTAFTDRKQLTQLPVFSLLTV